MPAYIGKETGNGRQAYIESQAEDYARKQAALKAAHEANPPVFVVWGVECPVLFANGTGSPICIAASAEGFFPMASTEAAKQTGMAVGCFNTAGIPAMYVEKAIYEWATQVWNLGGVWDE